MNKFAQITFLVMSLLSFMSCVSEKDYEDSKSRIEANEKQIATVNEQISAITGSISGLEAMDTQLKEYIALLASQASELQKEIEANAKAIETAQQEDLEALKALKAELEAKLNAINLALSDLQAKDAELESKIASLKEYVDKGLKGAKDWATATFSTIEQYNSTVTIIAGIKADIESVNQALKDLEAKLSDKIDTAISNLEDSLKKWVNAQLSAYYTIAQMDAKLSVIEKSVEDGDKALMNEINTLKTKLSEQKNEITEAYLKAIDEAINTNNGVIEGKIQDAVTEINGRITEEVASINQKIVQINNRLNGIEEQIATISDQIKAINESITQLESTDSEMKEYIQSLQDTAASLQKSIEDNAKEIESVESSLSEAIDAAKLEQLEALKALGDDLNEKLTTINNAITNLQSKDAELELKIANLKDYVDNELKGEKDWATATFSTIEQYNSTVTIIAGINANIDSINQAITNLETNLNNKISEAIGTLETSLKSWVNTQLTAYYTIAQIDAKIAIIEKKIDDADETIMGEINALKTQLSEQKTQITEAYQKAISDAITENNGVIDGKIQTAVDEVNGRITSEVATINQQITGITNRLNGIEESIAEILGMIQSIVVVPSYSDGDVALGEDETTLYFEVMPLDAAKKLESVKLTAFSLKAVSTIQTKADVEYKTLPIKAVEFEDDLVKITTSGKDINQEFFNGVLSLNARLSITDGLNSLSSSYFGLKPQGDVNLTALRIAEYKKKVIDRIMTMGGGIIIRFVDGSSVELMQQSASPRLYLDFDGYWSVSFNNGETSSKMMNSNAEFINAGDLKLDDYLSVRFIEDSYGRYSYQTYQSATPEVTIDELGTPVPVDHKNSVQSIVEDHVHHTATITTIDGHLFTFKQARIIPTGISVLTNKIKLAKGSTVYVDFRVNASNASFNYDITSSNCEISLDFLGDATKSSYVTTPTNYKVTSIEQVYDKIGAKKEGQYRAYISDLGQNTDYDELVALVLTINDGLGQTIQLSSSAIELLYSNDIITSFSILRNNNSGVLGDSIATIEGTDITILTPYIFDLSSLVPTFSSSNNMVYVGGELQVSGLTAQDFSSPVKYIIGENEYTVTIKKTGLPVVVIDTPNSVPITSKDIWTENATITIYNSNGTIDYHDEKLSIRGRGNFTWTAPKKPYALKLNKKSTILGMPSHKRWVLLANWMDRTLLRNDVSFYISKQTGLAWTPRGQFAEMILNGRHVGNYYLCEQIKVDKNRVNIKEIKSTDISGDGLTGGYLMELDNAYDETNKFMSSIRNLPYMFKEPDEDVLQNEQFLYFQNYIRELEEKLYADDWLDNREYEEYIDLPSFVDWWFIEELVRNLDAAVPRSDYMYKDQLGKLFAGPVWDFDYSTFIPYGNFVCKNAIYYNRLFSDPVFVSLVKDRWALLKTKFETVPDYIRIVADRMLIPNTINISIWPINSNTNGDESMSYSDAIDRMVNNYIDRLNWLDFQINHM